MPPAVGRNDRLGRDVSHAFVAFPQKHPHSRLLCRPRAKHKTRGLRQVHSLGQAKPRIDPAVAGAEGCRQPAGAVGLGGDRHLPPGADIGLPPVGLLDGQPGLVLPAAQQLPERRFAEQVHGQRQHTATVPTLGAHRRPQLVGRVERLLQIDLPGVVGKASGRDFHGLALHLDGRAAASADRQLQRNILPLGREVERPHADRQAIGAGRPDAIARRGCRHSVLGPLEAQHDRRSRFRRPGERPGDPRPSHGRRVGLQAVTHVGPLEPHVGQPVGDRDASRLNLGCLDLFR